MNIKFIISTPTETSQIKELRLFQAIQRKKAKARKARDKAKRNAD